MNFLHAVALMAVGWVDIFCPFFPWNKNYILLTCISFFIAFHYAMKMPLRTQTGITFHSSFCCSVSWFSFTHKSDFLSSQSLPQPTAIWLPLLITLGSLSPKSVMTSLLLNSTDTLLFLSYPTSLQDLTWLTTLSLLKVSPPLVSMTTPSPGWPPPWAILFHLFPMVFLLLSTLQIHDHQESILFVLCSSS